jgi:hypothetical protein
MEDGCCNLFFQIKSSDTAPISPRQYSWEQWRIPSTHHAFFLKSELLSLLKLPDKSWLILDTGCFFGWIQPSANLT